jgi:ketosteroid isomerase-like protein
VPQDNVELVRSILAAWGRGDFSDVGWAHPDIEFVIADGPMVGSARGLAEMGRIWGDFLASWEDFRAVAEEFRDIGDDRVLVLMRNGGRGKGSGIDVGLTTTRGANVFTVHDGKVTRLVAYADRDGALADL